jgi:MFS family permease
MPGLLAIVFTFLIKEKKRQGLKGSRELGGGRRESGVRSPESGVRSPELGGGSPELGGGRREAGLGKRESANLFAFYTYWKKSPFEYKRLVTGFLLFAMFNSSDVFLLLKMKESGLNDTAVIAVYIFYNLIYALMAYPVGILADKLGMKKVFLAGLFIFTIVYAGFAINISTPIFFVLFFLYGVYAAATEGISKAWISNIVPQTETATAIGTYTGFQSICALIASSLTGFLWFKFGGVVTFSTTAAVTLLVIVYLYYFHKTPVVVH